MAAMTPPPSPKERLERLRELLRRSRKLIGPKQGPLEVPEPANEATETVMAARAEAIAVLESPEFTGVLGFSELLILPFSLPSIAKLAEEIADNALYHYTRTKPANIEQTAIDLVTLLDLIETEPGGYIDVMCHGH